MNVCYGLVYVLDVGEVVESKIGKNLCFSGSWFLWEKIIRKYDYEVVSVLGKNKVKKWERVLEGYDFILGV